MSLEDSSVNSKSWVYEMFEMVAMRKVVLAVFVILCLLLAMLVVRSAFGDCAREGRVVCGVGEPLTYRSAWASENLSVSRAFDAMEDLYVDALREWVWRYKVFANDGTHLNSTRARALNETIMEALSRNITVMGMAQDFPPWMTNVTIDGEEWDVQRVPHRDLSRHSPYRKFLEHYEHSWETMSKAFPNITCWELGNEYNLHPFLHPPGYDRSNTSTWFSYEEQVNIVTDLLYYGSQGIHTGNPQAITMMCGLGPVENSTYGNGIYDIRDFLNAIYENIKSGKWNSTNPDDFFQVACWHPYLWEKEPTWSNWAIPNQAVYDVIEEYENKCKPVVFSEFGYSDKNVSPENVSSYLRKAFQLANDNFSWLDTIYWFRLLEQHPEDVNEDNPPGFGLFHLNWTWKSAAHAYGEICVPEFQSLLILPLFMVVTLVAVIAYKKKPKRL